MRFVDREPYRRRRLGLALDGSVFVPEAVAANCGRRERQTPSAWIDEPASWAQVVSVSPDEAASVAEWLDASERAASTLAERIRADLILIDDADGKAEAARRKFRVTGTLGVLRAGRPKVSSMSGRS